MRLRRDYANQTTYFTLGDPLQPDLAPAICAANADSVIVVWQAWRGSDYDVMMSVVDSTGASPQTNLSECDLNDRDPEVVWGDGQAWIVWSSYRGEPYNLMCRRFDGTSLTPAVRITTSYRARNLHPKIAFDETQDLLWVTWIWVNQGWGGFNNSEWPALYDVGSPRIRAFDGVTIFEPQGLDADDRFPIVPMESLGFERYLYDSGTRPMIDRYGPGLELLQDPGGRVWCFYKQIGTITELGVPNRYWGVVGLNYGGASWSSPTEFVEKRTSLGWESPAVVVARDSLWVAWASDNRAGPITPGVINLFGDDLNIVVTRFPADTAAAPPPSLIPIGTASAPGACPPEVHPSFTIGEGESQRTLCWGDTHRHSMDFSWDADVDPPLQQTIIYAQDFLGLDFLVPSDHCERYSPAVWAWARKWAQIGSIPNRFTIYPGYERSMQGFAGGHQNSVYRDPETYVAETAALPVVNNWHTLYAAQQGIDVLSIPHTTAQCGVLTDWFHLSNGNPSVLPAPLRVVEVYQALRESYEHPGCPLQSPFCTVGPTNGWVNVALAIGMRIGLIASSDHTVRACFAGVYSLDRSRDAIWDALYDRHTFGTSRETKMNVDFRVADAIVGSEVQSGSHPPITVQIDASAPLTSIEIHKDGNPTWFATSSAASDTAFTIIDPDPGIVGTSSYYYLRVGDALGHMIWTSPVWVDFTEAVTGVGDVAELDGELVLETVPNPAVHSARFVIRGIGPHGGRVRVHDVTGRLVKSLSIAGSERRAEIEWDLTGDDGAKVAAGTYYVVVQSSGKSRAVPLVVLR